MAVRTARRVVVAVVGGTLLLIGLAMTVLPGPALVVIPMGLAVLAVEFAWARHFLHRVREGVASGLSSGGSGESGRSEDSEDSEASGPRDTRRETGQGQISRRGRWRGGPRRR